MTSDSIPGRGHAAGLRHLVRPYVRTGGRTRAHCVLELQTMVSLPAPRRAPPGPEHREIHRLCSARPRSVAELAAFTALPLGVTRVLVDDLAARGHVLVDTATATATATAAATAAGGRGRGPDRAVMQRVLQGLRRL